MAAVLSRLGVGAASAALLLSAGMVMSTEALAVPVDQTITVECREGFGDPVIFERSVVLAPGDVLLVQTSGCNYTGYGGLFGTYQYVDDEGDPVTRNPGDPGGVVQMEPGSSVTYIAPDTTHAQAFQFSVVYYLGSSFYGDLIRFNLAVCPDGACAADGGAIPGWVQSFARSDQATPCPEGWAASWEQWPFEGRGGFVCTRSIPAYGDA